MTPNEQKKANLCCPMEGGRELRAEEEVFRQLDKQLERLMKFEARIAPLVMADFE